MSDHNEVKAISDNFQTVSLTGFTFIADRLPNDFEECLIVEKDGHLSAACWYTGISRTCDGEPGIFYQSRGGVLQVRDVLAWLPIEKCSIDINKVSWNPEYHLIASLADCLMVYAKDADPFLVIEYTGGDREDVVFKMDINTGKICVIDEDDRDEIDCIKGFLIDWYDNNKEKLVANYRRGSYTVLPE